MRLLKVINRFETLHPKYGYTTNVIGECELRKERWSVAYLWLQCAPETVRSLNLEHELESQFNISYIGMGQQHWLLPSVSNAFVEQGIEQCWVGWDWLGKPLITDRIDTLKEHLANACRAYEHIYSKLQSGE